MNIGFISFIPDSGHISPLLRLAAVFAARKYNVICYFPEESIQFADEFNVPVKSLGRVTDEISGQVFAGLSARSIFYNAFSCYYDLDKGYTQPIQLSITEKTEYIKEMLIRDNLSLIIADSNCFNNWYKAFAALTKAPLVIHLSEGNCRNWQRSFVLAYGLTNHSPWFQAAIEIIGAIFQQYYWKVLSIASKKNELKIFPTLQKSFVSIIKEDPAAPLYITSGLGFIEKEILKIEPKQGEVHQLLFPPVVDCRTVKLPQTLQEWFDRGGKKPVVYICLGTMVRGNKRLFRHIINGLKDLDINILWAAPDDQISLIKEIGVLPNLRIEKFVPQSQVLALEKVRCFITHGGAGSVQESLLCGKPMLCIPFMFDQPYNSSIAALLHVGIKLWKNKASARLIRKSVHQLLYDQEYWNAAQNIMGRLKAVDGGESILEYLRKIGMLAYKHGG